jgi:hypothetical protein
MRKKERNGPGMMTPSAARETDFPAGVVLDTRRADEEVLVVCAQDAGEQASRLIVPAKRTARERRNNFIANASSEPLRPAGQPIPAWYGLQTIFVQRRLEVLFGKEGKAATLQL